MRLTANTTPTDQARAVRLQLAWIGGDKYALDHVLQEVMDDPTGVPGLLFALTDFTTRLGEQFAPDYADRLRGQLIDHEQDQES
jgi:hypothetical protein